VASHVITYTEVRIRDDLFGVAVFLQVLLYCPNEILLRHRSVEHVDDDWISRHNFALVGHFHDLLWQIIASPTVTRSSIRLIYKLWLRQAQKDRFQDFDLAVTLGSQKGGNLFLATALSHWSHAHDLSQVLTQLAQFAVCSGSRFVAVGLMDQGFW
jgi:hypothetical protein